MTNLPPHSADSPPSPQGNNPEKLPQHPQQTPQQAVRTFRSEDLLAGQREVFIVHRGEVYRLRVTRRGKLILHK